MELVDGEVLELINLSTEPADFDHVDDARLIEAKVHAQIVLREVAASAAQLFHLRQRLGSVATVSCGHDDPAANARAIRLRADKFDLDPVALERGIAAQQLRNGVDAVDRNVDRAVVVVVAKGTTARRSILQNSRPSLAGHFLKASVAQITVETLVLRILQLFS